MMNFISKKIGLSTRLKIMAFGKKDSPKDSLGFYQVDL